MIKFENTEIYGWEAAIRGMRNPMNSWDKSDSIIAKLYELGENDLALMKNLVRAGTDHSKFMRMITVTVDITAPRYWWTEADTYKVGTVRNSCSTMHKIHEKKFTLDDFSHEHLNKLGKDRLEDIIVSLNYHRGMYNISDSSDKKKESWWQMIQLLPQSYNQRATMQFNYQVLRNIYFSRKDHKLDEWHDFCDWIKSLPYSELITEPSVSVPEWIKIELDEEGLYTNLPKEGEKVLFCKKNGDMYIGEVFNDKFYDDGDVQVYLGHDDYLDGVVAWMLLPKPYKENE